MDERAARREYVRVLGALLAGGVVALVVAQATWVVAGQAQLSTALRGTEVAPAVVACSLVAMAGAVGVLATRGAGRRLVGVVLVLVGLALVVQPVSVLLDPAGAARHPLAQLPGGSTGALDLTVSWWWAVLAALGGCAVALGGGWTAARGGRWATMAARYEAPSARRAASRADAWTLLDRGEDPTLDGEPGRSSQDEADPDAGPPGGDLQQ
jgi:hypothetical protein